MRNVLKMWNREIFSDINKQVKAETLLVDRLESQLQHRWDDDLYDSVKGAKSELRDLLRGRATLIASILGSLNIHTMSIIPVPKGCLQKMERLLANFLWDNGEARRRHWVR
ncbi:hypothetical protein QQ045_011208 [Rhodiola kirilowii]